MSPGGASVPILVMRCWLYPSDCTKHHLGIQEGHQYYLCMSHLYWNGHVNIFRQEHLWCLTDTFRWNIIACRLIIEKTPILSITDSADADRMLHHTRIILELISPRGNDYWDSSVLAYICKTNCDEVWQNTSPGYGISSNYLVGMPIMILNDVSSTFTNVLLLLLHKMFCFQILLVPFSWMLLYPLWYLLGWRTRCFLHKILLIHNHCRWCVQGSFGNFAFLLFIHLHHPHIFHVDQTPVDLWHLGIGITLYNYADNSIRDFIPQWQSLDILICSGQSNFWCASLGHKIWSYRSSQDRGWHKAYLPLLFPPTYFHHTVVYQTQWYIMCTAPSSHIIATFLYKASVECLVNLLCIEKSD